MGRPCSLCSHPDRAAIDEALLNGAPERGIAGRYRLGKGSVGRHKAHIGVALTVAAQRRAELEEDHGDDLLGQVKALTRDLRRALEDAKQAKSLSAFLQVTDRMQKRSNSPYTVVT